MVNYGYTWKSKYAHDIFMKNKYPKRCCCFCILYLIFWPLLGGVSYTIWYYMGGYKYNAKDLLDAQMSWAFFGGVMWYAITITLCCFEPGRDLRQDDGIDHCVCGDTAYVRHFVIEYRNDALVGSTNK